MAKKLKIVICNETATPVKAEVAQVSGNGDKRDDLQPSVAVQRWNAEETFKREASFDTAGIDKERRACSMSISSELPVNRGDYDEVLSHDPADCDMSRIASGSHPLLLGHDPERQIGVVESARIDGDKKIRAMVRFSKSQLGDEIWRDVQDGIRRLVSVGYKRTREVSSELRDGREVVRFAWQPYEASIVSVPADATVGIGRNLPTPQPVAEPEPTEPTAKKESVIMSDTVTVTDTGAPERKRVTDILAIEARMKDKIPGCVEACRQAISENTPVAALQDKLFTMLPGVTPVSRATIDVTPKDVAGYSLRKAILQRAEGKQVDGIERELSDEVARVSKLDAQGFWVPPGVLNTRADNIVATATMGGNLVATNLLAGQFVEILRNRAYVAKLGARMLDGLVGNVTIPRQLAAAVAYWTTEIESTTQSNTGFDQITLTPKAVTAEQIYSKQLLLQSTPSVDTLLRDDMIKVLALAIDKAALVSAASGPTAITATTGITTVTNAAAGAIPTFAALVSLESAVALGNADVGSLAYLTNPAVRGALRTSVKSTYSGAYGFLWESAGESGAEAGQVNGYPAWVTNQLARNNTFGTLTTVCSSIFFGNWSDLIIGSWGGLDVVVDPYSAAGTREIKIYTSQWVDLGVRHQKSFAWMPDALSA